MHYIVQALDWISLSLLLPVTVLLLAALASSLVSLGGFGSICLNVLRHRRYRREALAQLEQDRKLEFANLGIGIFARRLRELDELHWDELHCEKRIADWQRIYELELDRSGFMVKIGPMLGLMGTLIPMGPALAGLASGDVGTMAYNMQIAFATTVAGCFVAGVGLLVYSVKRHWYADEIAGLRYALDVQLRLRESANNEE